jgi:general secretion pathway protein K
MRASPAVTRSQRRRRGSVLIIVLITLVFAAFALVTLMDKATNDLLVDHREARTKRLRMEAYSALETTLAVLEDFRAANSGLHSPAEGWADPLGFAGFTPAEGHTIDVSFDDESGKVSLPRADAQSLSRLFQSWQVTQPDADMLADALMGWMHKDHIYSTPINPDYEMSAIPYEPPARSLRSYSELAAIDKVREFFYDADGRPNDYWRRFVANVSLFDYAKSNINGASTDALAALGQYDVTQLGTLNDYRKGLGQYSSSGPGVIKDLGQAQAIAGPGGNMNAFSTTISALRITITVHEGKSDYRVSAVVTNGNGARVVKETATSQRPPTSASSTRASGSQNGPDPSQNANANSPTAGSQTATNQNLRYPFTLLEIRENDEIPSTPSANPAS